MKLEESVEDLGPDPFLEIEETGEDLQAVIIVAIEDITSIENDHLEEVNEHQKDQIAVREKSVLIAIDHVEEKVVLQDMNAAAQGLKVQVVQGRTPHPGQVHHPVVEVVVKAVEAAQAAHYLREARIVKEVAKVGQESEYL